MAADKPHSFFREEMRQRFGEWISTSRLLYGVLLAGTMLLLIISLYTLFSDKQQRLLYGDLAPEDYLALSRWLEHRDIDYSADPEHKSIFVAADRVTETRLQMAEDRLPPTGGASANLYNDTGQLLLDALSGGDLTTVQRELSKTISALDHVRAARVHVTYPPEDRLSTRGPRATVLLTLTPGGTLSAEQLHGVIHLVSASVSGLRSDDVRVFDSSGRLLSTDSVLQGANYFPDSTLSYQTSLERSLEKKAQDLVDALIGDGRTLIKVAAELDFARNETTSERYNPDEAVVKSEQIERQPIGQSGPSADLESPAEQSSAARYRSSLTTSSKVDYEISRTTSTTISPVGEIKQLSVTILVADEKIIAPDGSTSFQPRSDNELEEIRTLVSAALSLKPGRGDVIHLKRMPMQLLDDRADPVPYSPIYYLVELFPVGKIVLLLVIFALFYFLLFRPVLGLLRSGLAQQRDGDYAAEDHDFPAAQPEPSEEDLSARLKEEVRDNPLAAAHIIKKWLQEA